MQVVEELVNGQVTRQYTYGLQRISEDQIIDNAWTASFYQYDGRGTVRMLTNAAGAVTDTYEYDAFGNEIAHTGTTPNVYLYRGERYDSDLGLYYLRARWYNPATGRFMTRDPYAGSIYDPASLHRYNYARANPVNNIDPSGRATASDYAYLAANAVARSAVVTAFGFAVNCALFAEASAMDLVGKTIDHQLDQFRLLFQGCESQITVSQFGTAWAANTALIGLGEAAGWAFRSIGGLMEGAAQGELAAGAYTSSAPWLNGVSNYTQGGTFLQCGQTCVSATGQILTDGAITEQQLVQRLGENANPMDLPKLLNQLGTSGSWTGTYFATAEDALNFANQGEFGAVLQSMDGAHMVTIEPIAGTNMFLVTDTGVGATYEVDSAWIKQWVTGGVWQVRP